MFRHIHGLRGIDADMTDGKWDMMVPARPLDIQHTVDSSAVDNLLLEIMDDPPKLPHKSEEYLGEPITISEEK